MTIFSFNLIHILQCDYISFSTIRYIFNEKESINLIFHFFFCILIFFAILSFILKWFFKIKINSLSLSTHVWPPIVALFYCFPPWPSTYHFTRCLFFTSHNFKKKKKSPSPLSASSFLFVFLSHHLNPHIRSGVSLSLLRSLGFRPHRAV